MAEEKNTAQRKNIVRQFKQLYDFTRPEDPQVAWLIPVTFVLPLIVVVLSGFLFKLSIFSWILLIILGVMIGFLASTYTLSRRAEKVGYKKIEGNPGAAGAILQSLNKRVFTFSDQPVWFDARTKDMIWRGTSLYGVYLVSEGPSNRVTKALEKEKEKIRRVTQGSQIRIITIQYGNEEGQVPLSKLNKAMRKRYKNTLTQDEIQHLNTRLQTLERMGGTGIPQGIDPRAAQHVSRRAMRGR